MPSSLCVWIATCTLSQLMQDTASRSREGISGVMTLNLLIASCLLRAHVLDDLNGWWAVPWTPETRTVACSPDRGALTA